MFLAFQTLMSSLAFPDKSRYFIGKNNVSPHTTVPCSNVPAAVQVGVVKGSSSANN
jgi:hypothetical protein